ncbi:hypothetical protein LIER_39326 [Lithospermum erythrorhizon]|uniref:Uncharacterized protein n=1 Tax=Lithospermum erythrorhizon TaxID=34254 RepID=A0AAV3QHD4_LITER
MIRAPVKAYCRADLPRGSALSRLQGDSRKSKEVKDGKIVYLTPLKISAENVFLEIEDRRLLSRPPWQKTSQTKRDMSKFYQYHKDHGDWSGSADGPPNITERVNVISGGRSGVGDFGRARSTYAKREIYAVIAGSRPEFPNLSFSRKDFEGIKCPHEDPLVIAPMIANLEVGRMLIDTRSLVDILFLDPYLTLGISREKMRPILHPVGGIHRGCGKPVGIFKPHGHHEQAPVAGHKDGGVHHCGDGIYGGYNVIPHSPQVEVPHTVWDRRNIGDRKKGLRLLSSLDKADKCPYGGGNHIPRS